MKHLFKTFPTFVWRESGRIPTAAAGLGLGIASLGWAIENVAPLGGTAQTVGAMFASLLLACVAGKFLLHPLIVAEELRHPVAGSILPTFAMGLMVVSKALSAHAPVIGGALWLLAVSVHLFFLAGFAWCHLRGFKVETMVPSWFVPPVGIVTAALTSPGAAYAPFADVLMVFGVASFALLLPVMVYRLIFHPEIVDAAKPTIAILAAPASLSLAGYLTVTPEPSLFLASLLLGVAVLLTAVIYIAMLRLLRLPFSPGYAAFTFPLVISSTAMFKAMHLFAAHPVTTAYADALRHVATAELVVASLIVFYVTCLYLRAGGKAIMAKPRMAARLAREAQAV